MQKTKCIIVEDEPLAITLLAEYISKINYLDLRGSFKSTSDASEFLQSEKVDLMFLDIHLPGVKGFTFLRTLLQPPVVIVTTAYHQYAVEGFELNVSDFLLKPFSFERFTVAVKKALKQIETVIYDYKQETDALYIMVDRKNIRIEYDSIIYINSKREYVHIITTAGNFISKISTAEIEAKLPKTKFRRIHRSYIIALNKIESFTKRQVMINGTCISIGKDFTLKELS